MKFLRPPYLVLIAVLACMVTTASVCALCLGQSSSQGDQTPPAAKKAAPVFHAAGIQGNIAPSGYSAGARDEETRQVEDLIEGLQAANFADGLPADLKLPCDRQADLVHAALAQPESLAANLRLGLFYLQHESPALSVKYLGVARSLAPGDPAVARYLATAEVAAKDYAAAGRIAADWIAANPANPSNPSSANASAEAHRVNAAIQAAAGNAEAALAEYNLAATLDPGETSVVASGLAVMALGFPADAEKLLAAGTAAHPESAWLWLARGMAEILGNKAPQAIDSLLRVVTLDPSGLVAPTLLATQADGAAADDARILAALRPLAAAKPTEAVAHYDYALALSKASLRIAPGDGGADADSSAKIESELKAAIAAQPRFAAAHFQLGVFYEDAGDAPAAVAEFGEANRLAPEVAAWHYRLARADRKAGLASSAEAEMRIFDRLKARRNAGGDVSAKLLEGLPAASLGIASGPCAASGLGDAPP